MSGSGSGKVILLGEHAVVHGVPAIAAGLPRGAFAELRNAELASGIVELRVAPWGVTARPGDGSGLGAALEALLAARHADRLDGEPRPLDHAIDATVTLPGSAGLGSSAALGVAVLRALDAHDGITRDFARAQGIALAWERIFHGNPSGIDTALALSGGLALYRRAPGPGQRALEPISARRPLRLVIGHSGAGGSTKEMVERVAAHREEAGWDETLASFGALVREGLVALEAGELESLGGALDRCHALLCAWGVSTAELDAMCSCARDAGALGAKLTGGGGGGCMIALVPDEARGARVAGALAAMGKDVFETVIGEAT